MQSQTKLHKFLGEQHPAEQARQNYTTCRHIHARQITQKEDRGRLQTNVTNLVLHLLGIHVQSVHFGHSCSTSDLVINSNTKHKNLHVSDTGMLKMQRPNSKNVLKKKIHLTVTLS